VTKRITSYFALTTFVLAVSGSAFAADLAVKAPPPAPAPVYNWTGWYAGVNAGASFGSVKTDFSVPVTVFTSSTIEPTSTFNSPGTGSDRTYPSGFIGGGQIGYNWQFSPIWVGGIEADFQGALEKDHSTFSTPFTATGEFCVISIGCAAATPVSGSTAVDYHTKIDWFGTARVRLGYVWGNGQVMSYLTGGFAYGKVSIDGTVGTSASGFPSVTQSFSNSKVNTGWVVGYGTEGVIDFWGAHNWTWRIEGLYMDLGHLDAMALGGFASVRSGTEIIVGSSTTTGPVSTHSHFTDGILRGGLSYKCLDEGLDRHARRELEFAKVANGVGAHGDAHQIIALPGALIG
jgi:outer membrane immunogenic protein